MYLPTIVMIIKMRSILLILFIIFETNGQLSEPVLKLIKLSDVCTVSEIRELDGVNIVLNIQCSELDRIESVADLDKIQWPDNPNGLKISAAFEGIGLSTLGKLPPNLQVESLRFSNNAIKTYWPDPFSDVPNLKKLSFSQNDLTEITPDLFTNIQNLEDLDLSYNRIAEFNILDFKHLVNLKKLNMQSNLLKKIPLAALEPVVVLEDLDLSKNGIIEVLLQESGNHVLKTLKRLNLSGNRMRSVKKDSFPVNNSIELIDLSNNVIEVIEEESFLTCTNLRELNLAQNNVTFTFALPPTLQIAILKINMLYHWPKFPSGITYIDLSYNKLFGLYDENNVDFEHLEALNIGGNQLKDLAMEKKLPKLVSLDLSYNLLTDVPISINTHILPNLLELRLDGNPIESIYFQNIISLKSLYMNDLNKLTVVEDKSFSNVIGRNIDEGESEKNCFSLFLSNCPSLVKINDGAFDGTFLCLLDISKNNLTKLSRSLLPWSSLSEGANLQFNPWHCSCDFQWILDDLLPHLYKVNPRMLTEFRCQTPRAFQGLRLVHFYNWTDKAMCNEDFMRSGPSNYLLEQATDRNSMSNISSLTLILGVTAIVCVLIFIGLLIYLAKTRRRYRVRQAALKRKRQSALDAKNSNGTQKEQFSALNRA